MKKKPKQTGYPDEDEIEQIIAYYDAFTEEDWAREIAKSEKVAANRPAYVSATYVEVPDRLLPLVRTVLDHGRRLAEQKTAVAKRKTARRQRSRNV